MEGIPGKELVKLVHFVRSFIRFSIGGEPNLFAMFFEKLYPYLTPFQKSKTSHKVHKLYQFLPRYSFLPASRLVPRPQCESALRHTNRHERVRIISQIIIKKIKHNKIKQTSTLGL